MNRAFRMRYIQAIRERYLQATEKGKGRILDELCKTCRLNRKYAIWKIHRGRFDQVAAKKKRRKAKLYSPHILAVVQRVWEAAGYPWSVRLKEILRLWRPRPKPSRPWAEVFDNRKKISDVSLY